MVFFSTSATRLAGLPRLMSFPRKTVQVPVRTLTSEAVAAKKPAEVSKVLAQEPWVEMSLPSGYLT